MIFNQIECHCGQRAIANGMCRDHYLDAFTLAGQPEWKAVLEARRGWPVPPSPVSSFVAKKLVIKTHQDFLQLPEAKEHH